MSKRKGEVSREKILSSAEHLFATQGFHGTTVSQIVALAGLTQAAFYLYFKSKKDILDEILLTFEQQLAHFADVGVQIRENPLTEVEGNLMHSYIGLFQLFGANKNVTKIVFQIGDQGEELRGRIINQIRENMKENQALGIIRTEVDTELLAELLVASIERIVDRYSLDGETGYSAADLGRSLAGIICHGVLTKSN
ncbi:TetR/AcrR family transcriptional regulator [Bacillus horti]|uniref:AcrR family transcriptional regulator n=1 Tax=Caldalkalibacillus horti TaxID=77523 RepID=A0ABT9VWJ6_9BACI|nr:TetR/AcrR family transcriptional regulator [Bacillus horti]MDQ0165348.1 AcrR family transcriptional regulator [Bacillus horti]